VATQLGWPDEWQAWSAWRAAVEQIGVLVFQFTKVALDEVRGLTLPRTPLPVAAINGKEFPEAKAFTLFHEVIHLMLAAGNEEAPALRERRSSAEWTEVERFAEVAASHALIPEDALQSMVRQLGLQAAVWDFDNVRRLARTFRLTPLATATRLRESGFMSWPQYNRWRAEWQSYVDKLPPRRGGFATPVEKAVNRAGRPFVQLVLEGLAANRITPVDAARYLDLKFEHFDKLKTHLMEKASHIAFDE
jgi:Zn-dependent peptidase ImmA (M78 family)